MIRAKDTVIGSDHDHKLCINSASSNKRLRISKRGTLNIAINCHRKPYRKRIYLEHSYWHYVPLNCFCVSQSLI